MAWTPFRKSPFRPATSMRNTGNAAGGYFNYTMKSGTNQYHGSAYDYFVNEVSGRRDALYRPMRPKRRILHGGR